MRIYILEKIEGDSFLFHSAHGTKTSAERARHRESGSFRMRPVPLHDADTAICRRQDDI